MLAEQRFLHYGSQKNMYLNFFYMYVGLQVFMTVDNAACDILLGEPHARFVIQLSYSFWNERWCRMSESQAKASRGRGSVVWKG